MKTLFKLFIGLFLFITLSTFAQSSQDSVQVDITKLTPAQLQVWQQLKQQQALTAATSAIDNLTPEKIDKYAQIGKSFGSAFKECWSAVSTDAERFAQSPAGKLAMVLVSWKIMGSDAMNLMNTTVHYLAGGIMFFVGVPFFMYLIRRNCVSTPILASKTTVFGIAIKKEYKGMSDPIHCGDAIWGYAFCFAGFIGLCAAIAFS